jgi:hypothetical protein
VNVSRPNKSGTVNFEKIELMWQERENYSENQSDKVYIIDEFLNFIDKKDTQEDIFI